MTISDLQGKRIYLIGYGMEGKATEKFLKSRYPDIHITIGDKTTNPNYLAEQNKFDIAIRSPGVNKKLITIPHTTATNLFFSEVKGKTIAVTGTKGKSTTTSLIFHLLKEAGKNVRLAGNIGKPMLEQLMQNNDEDTIWVIELSSYMLDDIEYAPDIAVIVSLYPDHIDYHGNLEAYYEAKHQLVKNMKPDGLFIYNPEFKELKKWTETLGCKSIPYNDFSISPENTPLLGEHNAQNIAAAATVAKQFGVSELQMYQALKTFQPLRHRLQKIGTYKGITFYDDAISTTPESTNKAIDSVPNIGVVFLGGLDRGYDFTPLVDKVIEKNIKRFVFFPDSGMTIKKLLDEKKYTFESIETSSMKEAVAFAYEHTPQNMVCLLSTASPSYSVWKNFEEKGDQFQQYVREYGEENSTQEDRRKTEGVR